MQTENSVCQLAVGSVYEGGREALGNSAVIMTLTKEEEAPAAPVPVPNLIYVVDDEPMVGEVVQAILEIAEYPSEFFQDPELAWRKLNEESVRPSLLLTDFLMTPINGMELIQRAKGRWSDLPAILYSGNITEEVLQGYPLRPDAFLRKPFLPPTLLELVNSFLRRDRPR